MGSYILAYLRLTEPIAVIPVFSVPNYALLGVRWPW
jgi:hypothetical protein